MFSFILEYRNIEREHLPEIDLGTSFFLVEILRKYIHLAGEFSWFPTRISAPKKEKVE